MFKLQFYQKWYLCPKLAWNGLSSPSLSNSRPLIKHCVWQPEQVFSLLEIEEAIDWAPIEMRTHTVSNTARTVVKMTIYSSAISSSGIRFLRRIAFSIKINGWLRVFYIHRFCSRMAWSSNRFIMTK